MSTLDRHGELEVWRPIPLEPNYEASSLGRIRRCNAGINTRVGRIVKGSNDQKGYLFVSTSHDGLVRRRAVHHLVCEAFNGPRPKGLVARHIDGNSLNNRPGNLAYGTQRENILDKLTHGTMPMGEKHPNVRIPDLQMLEILRDAKRIGQKPAARKHGLSQAVICRILQGKVRAYLLAML